ncbi:MAG: hypothetical protein ACREAM_25620 [Blastocatellia bacterium]
MKAKGLHFILSFGPSLGLALWLSAAASIAGQATMQNAPAQGATAGNPAPRPYSKDLNELRKRFNQDKGKARLLVLLSPT